MDILIVLFLSMITPFSLTLSGIDYTTGVGIKFSDSTGKHILSDRVQGESIIGNTDNFYEVTDVVYYGPYKLLPDFSVEYRFYPFTASLLKKIWLAPRANYEPFRNAVLAELSTILSDQPSFTPILFNQRPSFGMNLGYDIFKIKALDSTISMYTGMQFMRVGYEGESFFDARESYDNSVQYNIGINYKIENSWSLNMEMSHMSIDAKAAEEQKQDIIVTTTKIKAGVIYHLGKNEPLSSKIKEKNYYDIIESIDPGIKERINQSS